MMSWLVLLAVLVPLGLGIAVAGIAAAVAVWRAISAAVPAGVKGAADG